jgi:predicted permease
MWDSGGGANKVVWVPGIQAAPGEEGVRIGFATVMGDYFDTVGTRILRGRAIAEQDTENTPRVAVVNETAARLLWPDGDPVGKHFRDGGPRGKEVEVVGIAQDGRYNDLREKHKAYMFMAELQQSWDVAVLLVSTKMEPRGELNAVRNELKAIDPNVDILSAITMDEHMRYALFEDRALVQLVTAFGALGLVLAVVGLYGVVSYTVSRRTREIGIRVAVGARQGNVFGLILRRGLVLACAGIGIGVVLALVASSYVASLLHGVSPHDPLTFGVVVAVLFTSAMLASIIPARRATKVDPIIALRYE